MYTENELEISNKSYTNKDFATIYPELLDLVKKLTNKWDPTTSNESDPGVVLLKVAALVADKNNYNIDKNILETFPLSVTQMANARKLYDMLGYTMNWYKAADTKISFTYRGSALNPQAKVSATNEVSKITIPQWTMVTDDTSSVIYTLTKPVILNQQGVTVSGDALQGTLHDYEVNGVTDITLDNLDSDLRLFFTEKYVAENGIFITNKGHGGSTSFEEWTKVDNLESAELNQKNYKFGVLPNSDTCYIQFPQDIGNLIENGLNIKYLITQGSGGNINANTLTTLYQTVVPSEFDAPEKTELNGISINDDITIQNVNSTTNGADPEDLDSAYTNYKKTVGTFETLVTLRDYENAIYRARDDFDNPLVSNVVVSDRTCDLHRTTNVVQKTTAGTEYASIVKTQDHEIKGINSANNSEVSVIVSEPVMTAFDIGLYILDNVNTIENEYQYNKSFSVSNDLQDVHAEIEKRKCIKHEYIDTTEDPLQTYLYKAFYKLQGKVTTTYKVTQVQAKEIEDKIRIALYKKYNARNVNFGEPINYDELLNTIQSADTRIKTVVLADPEYFLREMLPTDDVGTFKASRSPFETPRQGNQIPVLVEFLAKMILSGNVQLYNFNQDVTFSFGQTDITKYAGISSVTSSSTINTSDMQKNTATQDMSEVVGYTVDKNTNLQLYAPNLYTKTSYTTYVNYVLIDSTSADNSFSIPQNTYYKLGKNQKILVNYTDSNQNVKFEWIESDTIVRYSNSSDTSAALTEKASKLDKTYNNQTYKFSTLSSSEQLDVLAVNESKFVDTQNIPLTSIPCMWFTHKKNIKTDGLKTTTEYILFDSGETEKILEENEYFIYTNQYRNELIILGSGTLLKRETNSSAQIGSTVSFETSVSASALIAEGQNAISENDWFPYNQNMYGLLSLTELQIVTLGEGSRFRAESIVDESGAKVTSITNTPVRVIGGQYCEDPTSESWKSLIDYQLTSSDSTAYTGWKMRSRLNLLFGSDYPQTLVSNSVATQNLNIKIQDESLSYKAVMSWATETGDWTIRSSERKLEDDNYVYTFSQFDGEVTTFEISTTNYDNNKIAGIIRWGANSQFTVEDSQFTFDGVVRMIKLVTESLTSSQRLNIDLQDLSILSNTVIGSSGGEDLDVSSTSGDAVDIYAYTNTELPKVDSDNYLYVDENNEIQITYRFLREYSPETVNLPFSYKGRKCSSSETLTDVNKTFIVPVTLHGTITDKVIITAKGGADNIQGDRKTIELTLDNPVDYIIVTQPFDQSKLFKGIEVSNWTYDTTNTTSYSVTSTVNTITIDNIEIRIVLSASNKLQVTMGAKTTEYSVGDFFKIGSSWLQFVEPSENSTNYKVLSPGLTDFIQVGAVRIIENNERYSEQVQTTVDILARNYETTAYTLLDDIEKYIMNDAASSSSKYAFKFDKSYIVPEEDRIDTETTDDNNKNYLFSTTAIFDSNHILNKYIIPQLMTGSETSIKVSSQSITR